MIDDGVYIYFKALPLVTVVYGAEVDGPICTVTTLAQDVGDERTVTFKNPSLQHQPIAANGTCHPLPKWARYVEGVALCFKGLVIKKLQ